VFASRYLRSLCDQIALWSLAEMTSLLFVNLSVVVASAVNGVSSLTLTHEIIGLALIIAMECACEGMVLVVMVRWANLPMVSSWREKGVVRCMFLTCLLAATACVLVWLPFMHMAVRRSIGQEKWRDVDAEFFCPTFSDVLF